VLTLQLYSFQALVIILKKFFTFDQLFSSVICFSFSTVHSTIIYESSHGPNIENINKNV